MRLPRFMGMLLTSGTALLYPRAAALADMEVQPKTNKVPAATGTSKVK